LALVETSEWHAAMKKLSKSQRAARKRGEDESTESFRVAARATGKSKPKGDKKVRKFANALRKDDPTQDRRSKFKD
jgi:hypothetical protein